MADRSKVKHLAFDMISKQMIVQKTIRLPFESIAVDIMIVEQNGLMASNLQTFYNERYWPTSDDEIVVTCLSKRHRTLCAISGNFKEGHLYYKRGSEMHEKQVYTCMKNKDDLVYVGSSSGSVYVFESLTGQYVKEIPFQKQSFSDMRVGTDSVEPSPVQKVSVNGTNHLLAVYEDDSFILLDQDAK